ncbi:MAG TPA: ATP-binding protein [Polyangia bacterium]|nr:ATP-binding protein [Polyangia bacterium]
MGLFVTPLHLDLPLTISPAIVSPTRRLLESKLAPVLEDDDALFRVAMAAHELLENAAKYASDGKARLEVEVSPRADDALVRVVVTNNATRENIDNLGACFAEMKAESDAMAHYFALMRRNAKNGSISRLGLARVRAEGEMEIAVDIEGDTVKVVASAIVPHS